MKGHHAFPPPAGRPARALDDLSGAMQAAHARAIGGLINVQTAHVSPAGKVERFKRIVGEGGKVPNGGRLER